MRPSTGGADSDWLIVPAHWLAQKSPRLLDGVGKAHETALAGLNVKTIGALAEMEPVPVGNALPLAKTVELRSKARLAVRTAANVAAVPALAQRTAWDVITMPPSELPEDVSPMTLETLREQLSALQLSLDARYLKHVTVGELSQKTRS